MEPTEEARFAESVQRLREDRGWSQGELARRMTAEGWETYSQMTVSRTEKLERPVRLGEASALARLFGVSLVSMMAGIDDERARVHRAAQAVAESDHRLREAIQDYEARRFELAMLLDHVKPSGYSRAVGESWIDTSAYTVIDRVHQEELRAGRVEMDLMGVTESDVASNQLEGHWVERLARVDNGEHQAEG